MQYLDHRLAQALIDIRLEEARSIRQQRQLRASRRTSKRHLLDMAVEKASSGGGESKAA
jgi:hypothetical protein